MYLDSIILLGNCILLMGILAPFQVLFSETFDYYFRYAIKMPRAIMID